MLKRKIYEELLSWKGRSKHKSLIISGQRQIGKTYVIEEMLAKQYGSFININFIKTPEYKVIFDGNLDTRTLIQNIGLYIPGTQFIEGDTLILFDELQECPNALASMKFWTQDGRYDVIGMGSALGMTYKNEVSYPVGQVEHMDMYSLDFEEFLWALGIEESFISSLAQYFSNIEKLPQAVMNKMNEYLIKYMIVGGMPEAVECYVTEGNLEEVHSIQSRLITDYRNDIARYADANVRIKAQQCYNSIMYQLNKPNHKFQYSLMESKATSKKFESSLDWLINQIIVIKVNNLSRIEYPLEAFADELNFRIYPTDISMLVGAYDISLKRALLEDSGLENTSMDLVLGVAKGGLYEALAADILYKKGYRKLYFYKNEKNTSEIEFVIERNGELIPVEIKAGRKQARSLNNILINNEQIKTGYKMASKNIGQSGKLITMPMFMLMFM